MVMASKLVIKAMANQCVFVNGSAAFYSFNECSIKVAKCRSRSDQELLEL